MEKPWEIVRKLGKRSFSFAAALDISGVARRREQSVFVGTGKTLAAVFKKTWT